MRACTYACMYMIKPSNKQKSKRRAVTIAITLEQAAALDRLLAGYEKGRPLPAAERDDLFHFLTLVALAAFYLG